jgi:hypothetical protein
LRRQTDELASVGWSTVDEHRGGRDHGRPGTRLDFRQPAQRTFLHLLLNTLTVSVMNFTVWFAVTFWVYLETQSVFATGMIAGIFLIAIASTGIWFGSLVDHHHQKRVIQASAAVSLVIYTASLVLYLLTPDETLRPDEPVGSGRGSEPARTGGSPRLRRHRHHRPGNHAARPGQPLLPRPQRRGRRWTERAGRRERVCPGRSGLARRDRP